MFVTLVSCYIHMYALLKRVEAFRFSVVDGGR